MTPAATWLFAAILLFLGCGDPIPAKNIVIISIDTLRADRLGSYGYGRATSPRLDEFAEKSLRYTNVTASATNTLPSHISMFTGRHPTVHGMFPEIVPEDPRAVLMPKSIPTLAERLTAAGFATAAFTDGGYMGRTWDMDRGFEEFSGKPQDIPARVDQALDWLAKADRSKRFFLFVHTYEVHSPYVPPKAHDLFGDAEYEGRMRARVNLLREVPDLAGTRGDEYFIRDDDMPSPRDARYMSDLYDGGIHFADAELGRLLDVLTAPPWSEDTAILVTSDHGESFLEHHALEHTQLYQQVLHVPFILHRPSGAIGTSDVPVSGVDVAPTVMDLLGLPVPAGIDGFSVLRPIPPDRLRLSYNEKAGWGGGMSLRRANAKVLRNADKSVFGRYKNPDAVAWQRFDLQRDPSESNPLPMDDEEGRELAKLVIRVNEKHQEEASRLRKGKVESRALAPEVIEELRRLGYIE